MLCWGRGICPLGNIYLGHVCPHHNTLCWGGRICPQGHSCPHHNPINNMYDITHEGTVTYTFFGYFKKTSIGVLILGGLRGLIKSSYCSAIFTWRYHFCEFSSQMVSNLPSNLCNFLKRTNFHFRALVSRGIVFLHQISPLSQKVPLLAHLFHRQASKGGL